MVFALVGINTGNRCYIKKHTSKQKFCKFNTDRSMLYYVLERPYQEQTVVSLSNDYYQPFSEVNYNGLPPL